jgi:GntR family transcriptional regulator, carbon starvation induced regulator
LQRLHQDATSDVTSAVASESVKLPACPGRRTAERVMDSFESDREASLVLQGYSALRTRIVRAEYPPGMRLKLEALQQSLGVSSSPLREALNRLVAEGLVEAEEGRGFRAASVSSASLRELTYVRVLIEGDALRRSVTFGDDDWEGRIVAAFHKLQRSEYRNTEGEESASVDPEGLSERHRQFHLALLSGTGFPGLLRLCETYFDQAERYRRIARLSDQPRRTSIEHKRLYEAALDREADEAVKLLTAHIQRTTERVLDVLSNSNMLLPEATL